MIQPLRTVHRRTFVVLGFVLPAILVVGLGARRPQRHASAIAAQVPDSAQLVRKSDSLWQRHAMQTQFYRDPRKQEIYAVLLPAQELNQPDLLLYWAANAQQGESLPTDAQLLGSFTAGKALVLPSGAQRGGHLILFSLAHQAVADTATVESLP
jgi:hypothetical protein